MNHDEALDQRLQALGDTIVPDPSFVDNVMSRVANVPVTTHRRPVGGMRLKSYITPRRVLLAASLACIAFVWAFPFGGDPENGSGRWSFGSLPAHAQDISSKLEQARVDGIIARSRTTFVMDDGTESVSSTVSTYFFSSDHYRLDIRDDGKLREIQWYAPSEGKLVQTAYRLEDGSTSVDYHEMTKPASDPISELVGMVGYIKDASQKFDPKQIDGHQCVGFEIDAKSMRPEASGGVHRIWFDSTTKLPVLVEFDRPVTTPGLQRMISTLDRFEWNPRIPADTFTPRSVPDREGLR